MPGDRPWWRRVIDVLSAPPAMDEFCAACHYPTKPLCAVRHRHDVCTGSYRDHLGKTHCLHIDVVWS
jgi:hypothetical protein